MKYKNIVFDFGNVIGTFNGREIILRSDLCTLD